MRADIAPRILSDIQSLVVDSIRHLLLPLKKKKKSKLQRWSVELIISQMGRPSVGSSRESSVVQYLVSQMGMDRFQLHGKGAAALAKSFKCPWIWRCQARERSLVEMRLSASGCSLKTVWMNGAPSSVPSARRLGFDLFNKLSYLSWRSTRLLDSISWKDMLEWGSDGDLV